MTKPPGESDRRAVLIWSGMAVNQMQSHAARICLKRSSLGSRSLSGTIEARMTGPSLLPYNTYYHIYNRREQGNL
jgi:hypothetical protein